MTMLLWQSPLQLHQNTQATEILEHLFRVNDALGQCRRAATVHLPMVASRLLYGFYKQSIVYSWTLLLSAMPLLGHSSPPMPSFRRPTVSGGLPVAH